MPVKVYLIGCGDAFGNGGRYQSCFLIEDSKGRIALDFGASSLIALKRQNIDPASLNMVVISHLHGDHFAGLPYLLLDLHRVQSTKQLILAGPPGFINALQILCNAMYPEMWERQWTFPLELVEIVPGQPVEFLGRNITTRQVSHSSRVAPPTGIRMSSDGKTIGYSGDTGWTEELVILAEATQLFICECNFFFQNPSTTHMSYKTIMENTGRLRTERLILTHLGEEALDNVDKIDIEIAEDGKVVNI